MRISDWSSDVCSSDLVPEPAEKVIAGEQQLPASPVRQPARHEQESTQNLRGTTQRPTRRTRKTSVSKHRRGTQQQDVNIRLHAGRIHRGTGRSVTYIPQPTPTEIFCI